MHREPRKALSPHTDLPAILVKQDQAAAILGMSVDSFTRYVRPDLKVLRVGRLPLFRVADLHDWVNDKAKAAPSYA